MFTAYIDDSKTDKIGDRRYYLAGYIATTDNWKNFVKDWARELDTPPSIKSLHTNKAYALKDEFYKWPRKRMERKLKNLSLVIRKHNLVSFEVSVNQNEYERIVSPFAMYPLKDPFALCFHVAVQGLARYCISVDYPHPIDFVFDEHGKIGYDAAEWFQYIKLWHPEYSNLLKSQPSFKDDELALPLQAADMLAWHLRRKSEKREEELPLLEHLISDHHIWFDANQEFLEKLAKDTKKIEGINTIQTKKQWKALRPDLRRMTAAGLTPDNLRPSSRNVIKRTIKTITRFIRVKLFGCSDES